MSGWSCPHLDLPSDWCRRLKAACVLGRKGCVLPRQETLRFLLVFGRAFRKGGR